jgi:CRISPR-associated endoribonuclease Cas6
VFASLIFDLEPDGPVEFIGDHLHGWFIGLVKARDAALANRLHAPVRGKPFTLWAGPRFSLGQAGMSRDATDLGYWLRITSVDLTLTTLLARFATAPETRVVFLGRSRFKRVATFADADQHAWTGVATAKDLWATNMAGPQRRGRVRLSFLSPTAFSRGRSSTTLLPIGQLVFRSLIKTWNENTVPTIDDALEAELLGVIQEEAHEIHSVSPLRFQDHKLKGFVGSCEYSCGRKSSEDARRLLHLLSDFAFFAGVGLKRTMGMGQVIGEDA